MAEETDFYKLCPQCDFFCHSREDDKYCSLCGTALMETCRSCGEKIGNPYAKFCRFCGTPLRPGTKQDVFTQLLS